MFNNENAGLSIPFDSSLYGATYSPDTPTKNYTIEYENCDAVSTFFTIGNDISPLLPDGVEPTVDPPLGAVFFARYPYSTVGAYNEYIALIQVTDLSGNLAYYIPYIYVTNDAALAAGRELAGAPKKLADIDLSKNAGTIQGTLERPEGRRLATLTVKPDRRADEAIISEIMPLDEPIPLLSIRHVPPIEGGDGLSQLVKWYTKYSIHDDETGSLKMWQGPDQLSYDSPSRIDPVHKIDQDESILSTYSRFDMELGLTEVQKEWTH